MAEWSQVEQLMLELINRARLDPLAEAARLGTTLNEGLAPGTISGAPKQVLAPNTLLNDSARGHSQWMLDNDIFSHTGVNASDPGDRMVSAGYQFTGNWTWGENIAWQGTTGTANPNTMIVDEYVGLFHSEHHRENTLNGSFTEIGVGALSGQFTTSSGTAYNALMTTENFAKSGSGIFVTGVAYDDGDGDRFYGIGEAHAGIGVAVASGSTSGGATTASAGGYAVNVAAGQATVTFSGGGLSKPVTVVVDASVGNVKVDLVDGVLVQTSGTTTLGDGAIRAALLGGGTLTLIGNAAGNGLAGNRAGNVLDGLTGNDTLAGGGGNDQLRGGFGNDLLAGGVGNDVLYGQAGNDTLNGGSGNDILHGGAGNDVLIGGVGQDRFYFTMPLLAANADSIADFAAADDTIRLDDAVFSALSPAAQLAEAAFAEGSAATTSDQRIIHDRATGALYYDADGVGGAAQVKFASVVANLSLTAADLEIV